MSSKDHNLSEYDSEKMPDKAVVAGQAYAVVVSDWNQEVTSRLCEGAIRALKENGAGNIEVFHVPGAFELTFAAKTLIQEGKYDAIIVLGSVVGSKRRNPAFRLCVQRSNAGHYDVECQKEGKCPGHFRGFDNR